MTIHYRTLGLVLQKIDQGEANQLLTIYTKDFGKLEILGRAIRKITSKLRAGADIFCMSEFEFIQGKNQKTLTDAILLDKFPDIRRDSERFAFAQQIAQIAAAILVDQEQDEQTWDLLQEIFSHLNNPQLSVGNLVLLYDYFAWNLLAALGYQIDLYHCARCQQKLSPENLFLSIHEGGIVHELCAEGLKETDSISAETVKVIRLLLEKNWKTVTKLKIDELQKNALRLATEKYLLLVFREPVHAEQQKDFVV